MNFEILDYYSVITVIISLVYLIMLLAYFAQVTANIQQELISEVKHRYWLRSLFDYLQEGVIVFCEGKIEMMNDVSKKMLCGMQTNLQRKLFYLNTDEDQAHGFSLNDILRFSESELSSKIFTM